MIQCKANIRRLNKSSEKFKALVVSLNMPYIGWEIWLTNQPVLPTNPASKKKPLQIARRGLHSLEVAGSGKIGIKSRHNARLRSLEMRIDVHTLMQDAHDFDQAGALHSIIDDVAAGRIFAIAGANAFEAFTLVWVFGQRAKTAIELGQICAPLLASPSSLRVAADLPEVVEGALCQRK